MFTSSLTYFGPVEVTSDFAVIRDVCRELQEGFSGAVIVKPDAI